VIWAKAFSIRNLWIELRRYLDDGRIPFDNNLTEQLMRQVAIGEKTGISGPIGAILMTSVQPELSAHNLSR
jgi:hypothetical protein